MRSFFANAIRMSKLEVAATPPPLFDGKLVGGMAWQADPVQRVIEAFAEALVGVAQRDDQLIFRSQMRYDEVTIETLVLFVLLWAF